MLGLEELLDKLFYTRSNQYSKYSEGGGYGCDDNHSHEYFRIKHPVRIEGVDDAGNRREGLMEHLVCRRCEEHKKEHYFDEWSYKKQGLTQKDMWEAIGVDIDKFPLVSYKDVLE